MHVHSIAALRCNAAKHGYRIFALSAFIATALTPCWGSETHFPGPEDLNHLREVSEIQLAPDNVHLLATITDSTADGGKSHLWLLDRVSGESRQLTYSISTQDKGEDHGSFAPDSRLVLFIADRGDGPRLYRLPMAGGEAQPLALARSESDVINSGWSAQPRGEAVDAEDFLISPDGKTLALIASDADSAAAKAKKAQKNDAIVFEDNVHKRRLYLIDMSTGSAREVIFTDAVSNVSWNATSEKLLAVTKPRLSDLGPNNMAWVVDIRQPMRRKLVEDLPITVHRAIWASDSRLALLAHCGEDSPPTCLDLYSYDLNNHQLNNLSENQKANVAYGARMTSTKTGHTIVITLQRGLLEQVAAFNLDGPGVQYFDVAEAVTSYVTTNEKQTGWAYLSGGPMQPTAPYFAAKLGMHAAKVKTPDLIPADWNAAQSQRIEWLNQDETITGLLYLPEDAENKKVPLIVNVHGGPAGRFSDDYHPLVNLLVGQGWAVLEPNPRGSSGYGPAFEAANRGDLGGEDFNDIMAGIDSVLSRYPIDRNRLALVGYSYGGEMAGFAAGKTHRFKAIVSGGPVVDQLSEYGTEGSSWYDRWYIGNPIERMEAAWRQSPLSYLMRAKTPVLILQGKEDQTDPLGQSLEMYRALRQSGNNVELIIYPRESHVETYRNFAGEVSREPQHGIDLRTRMIAFITSAFAKARE